MTTARYSVHGLVVESELPLPLERSTADAGRPAALVIRRAGVITAPDATPPGTSLGSLGAPPDRVWWSLDGAMYRVRFAAGCELRLGPPWRVIEVAVDPRSTAEVVGDRIVKTGMPFVLERLGHDLLHASAVYLEGTTLAVAGASGSGKSTLVALLCADGGSLISDDQLRVELEPDAVACHPGLDSIRLRPAVREVAELVGFAEPTRDGRIAVSPGSPATGSHHIDALVFTTVVDDGEAPTVEPLRPSEAMMRLSSSRAVPTAVAGRQHRFHLHAGLLERLPALGVRLRRGSLPDREFRKALISRANAAAGS